MYLGYLDNYLIFVNILRNIGGISYDDFKTGS